MAARSCPLPAPRHLQANDIFRATMPTAEFDIMDPLIAGFNLEALKRRYNRLQRQEWPRNKTLRAAPVRRQFLSFRPPISEARPRNCEAVVHEAVEKDNELPLSTLASLAERGT